MAFQNRIFPSDMNAKHTGATKLPNQPKMSATDLKKAFDAPSKDVITPKFNGLIDELEASSAAIKIGAVNPADMSVDTVQGVLNNIAGDVSSATIRINEISSEVSGIIIRLEDVGDMKKSDYDSDSDGIVNCADTLNGLESTILDLDVAVANSHEHYNKDDVLDKLSYDTYTDSLTFDGDQVGDMMTYNYDSNADGIVDSADTLNGLQATINELNSLEGITGAVQYQLDDKIGRSDGATGQTIYIADDVSTSGELDIGGSSLISGDLTVAGDTQVNDLAVWGDITDPLGHKINAVADENGDGLCPQLPDSSSAYGLYLDAYGQWSLPPGASPDYLYYYNLVDPFSDSHNYTYGDYVAYFEPNNNEWEIYKFWTDHPAGAWTGNDVTRVQVLDEMNAKLAETLAPAFSSGNYSAGDYVTRHGSLCRFITNHTGAWSDSDVDYVVLSDGLDKWAATTTVSNGSFTFSGLDDTKGWAYKPFAVITDNSVNKNPSSEISSISGSGTSNMSITYATDADNGSTIKLRAIR